MTPEERAASYPLDTEDVPRDKQIIAESATQKAQRGAATPRALTGTALASTAATAAAPTTLDYGLGILDAAANTGSALAAGPFNAALNLGHLALPIPTDYIKQRSDDRLRALDYQPRTQIGRDIDQQFKQGAASLLGPTMQTVGDAYDRSLTKQGIDLLSRVRTAHANDYAKFTGCHPMSEIGIEQEIEETVLLIRKQPSRRRGY